MNNDTYIKDLIRPGEGETLEFKSTIDFISIGRSLCAFLNHLGGSVVVGVNETGKIEGVEITENEVNQLQKQLLNKIAPQVPISFSIEEVSNKKVLTIKVYKGDKRPYLFEKNIYLRKKSRNVKPSSEEIIALINERQEAEKHWEKELVSNASLDDIDQYEILKTMDDLRESGRGKTFKKNQVIEFLTYYNLYENGSLTNAAMLLFGKEPSKFIPQSRIRVTIYKSNKTGSDFNYDKFYEGNLFKKVKEITQFFEVNIATSSKFKEGEWQRTDRGIPLDALREGLMNAIVHKDYTNISGSIAVAFYPNRLEITNNGELPSELKPLSRLAKNHLSLPPNPDIAHIFFIRRYIEKVGRGTVKMIEDCIEKGFEKPKWKSSNGITTLTFHGITALSSISDTANDTVNDTVNDTIVDTVNDTVNDTVSDKVKTRLIEIVKLVLENPGVKSKEIAEKLNVSPDNIRRDINKLNPLIEFIGPSYKTGGYHISKSLKRKLG